MKNCKSCKYLNITIIPPSDEQWCAKRGEYVKLDGCCEDYIYDKANPFIKFKEELSE